jgi:WD40 repeat protein
VSAATVQERPWDEPVLRPRCLAFAPSGRLLAIGCDDGKVRFYDWPSGRADGRDVDVSEPVTALAFSTDGRTLAAGGRDGGLHVLDADDRRPMGPRFGGRDQIEALAFSPDGRTLAAGGRDGAARLWDVRSGLPLGGPLRHGGAVRSVAYHPDGKSLWTAGHDQVLIRWRLPAGPASSTPEQLRLTAELLAGAALDDDGTPRSLDADQRRERRERLDQLGGPPKL